MNADDNNGPTLRRATLGDATSIADVWLTAFRATYAFPPAHSDDAIRDWVRDRLLSETETWVAASGNDVVGFISLGAGEVEQLYLRPAWTGRGLGSSLMALAKERQPQGLALWTFQVNSGARRFYERHGFRAVKTTDGTGNEEGQPDVRYAWRP